MSHQIKVQWSWKEEQTVIPCGRTDCLIKISRDTNTKGSKQFAYINGPIDLLSYILETNENERVFYEIIHDTYQKPHFDIDIKTEDGIDHNQVLKQLLMAIELEFKNKKINNFSTDKNIVIFNSHGPTKFSYHIIIDKFKHENAKEAKAFYDAVMSHITIEHLEKTPETVIDHSVYKCFQNFRLLFCHKNGSTRVKQLDKRSIGFPFFPSNTAIVSKELVQLRILEASLISYVPDCALLPSWIEEKPKIIYNNNCCDIIERNYDKIASLFNGCKDIRFQYELGDINGSIVVLKRISKGRCPVHGRIHDKSDAYMTVTNNGNLIFRCYRSNTGESGIHLGTILSEGKTIDTFHKIEESDDDDCGLLTLSDRTLKLYENGVCEEVGSEKGTLSTNIQPTYDNDSIYKLNKQADNKLSFNIIKESKELDISTFINDTCRPSIEYRITLEELLLTYQKYCNNNNYTIKYTTICTLSKELHKSGYPTKRKYVDQKQVSCLVDYVWGKRVETNISDVQQLADQGTAELQQRYKDMPVPRLTSGPRPPPEIESTLNIDTILEKDSFALLCASACGMGKTQEFKKIPKDASILIVCNRKTLVSKMVNDLNGGKELLEEMNELGFKIKSYLTIDGDIDIRKHKQVAVQIDSLYRVIGQTEYLLLDEYTYSIRQLVTFSKNKSQIAYALESRIKHTPKVIACDAIFERCDVNFFMKYRNDVIIYENLYPKQQHKTVNFIKSKQVYYHKYINEIENGMNIINPCGSKDEIKAIQVLLEEEFPELKVGIYTSDNVEDGVDPVSTWDQYNVVLFTSVCEAGNSFTKHHFNKVYCHFNTRTFPAESAVQMIFRARCLIDSEINIYIDEKAQQTDFPYCIKNLKQLRKHILAKDELIIDELKTVLRRDVMTGTLDYDHPYFDLYCIETWRQLRSQRNYSGRMIQLLKAQGVKCGKEVNHYSITKEQLDEGKVITNTIRDIKHETREADLIELLRADTNKYVDEYKEYLTKEEKNILKKHKLMRLFPVDNFDLAFLKSVYPLPKSYWNYKSFKDLDNIKEIDTIVNNIYNSMVLQNIKSELKLDEQLVAFKQKEEFKKCWHLISILRIMNVNTISSEIEVNIDDYSEEIYVGWEKIRNI